jgi:nucleoside-diphosphate-sugar epimerase
MKVLVTGSTGFLGRHVIPILLDHGHEIVATARSREKAKAFPWYERVSFVAHDIHNQGKLALDLFGRITAAIHLAWQGLPNYKSLFHFEENLPAHYHFLKHLLAAGVEHLLVTGTCFEYGMQNGCLLEDMPTFPANPYGLAKDTLRKFLQELQRCQPFRLQWVRLFYIYGPGQNPNSLLAQLERAIDEGKPVFNMSGGEQLRDYLPVEEAARRIVKLFVNPCAEGVFNCCRGEPISVRRLVEERIAERNAKIELNLGHFSYPDHEPMAFWGDIDRFKRLLGNQ